MKNHANRRRNMIRKTININEFKSHANETIPSFINGIKYISGVTYEDIAYNTWGKIPYGFILEDINKDDLGNPSESIYEKDVEDETNFVLHNKTMNYVFYKINEAINTSKYYKFCNRNGKNLFIEISDITWGELIEEDSFYNRFMYSGISYMYATDLDYLTDGIEHNIGEVICVCEYKDFLDNIFPTENTDSTYNNFQERIEKYLTFVKDKRNNKEWWKKKEENDMLRSPLIRFSLLFEQEIEDGGVLNISLNGEESESSDNEEPVSNVPSSSQLYQLKGTIYSIDSNGKELPFVIEETYKEYLVRFKDNMAFIPFLNKTLLNVRYRNGSLYGSIIKDISISEGYSANDKIVTFNYIIDGEVDESGSSITSGTGIEYVDKCYAVLKTENFTIENESGEIEEKEITYLDINYSDISSVSYVLKEKKEIGGNLYKTDSTIHIQDYSEDIDISIDRGSYAAFERHNILSEINTMEDMENYRNDFFKIKN